MPLWAVQGDPNTDINGALIATNPQTVYIWEIPVIVDSPDHAEPDDDCPGGAHCDPMTAQGSPNVFAYNIPVHRQDDLRACGALTVVVNQNNVFVNEDTGGGAAGGEDMAAATTTTREPVPYSSIRREVLEATTINYTRAVLQHTFNAGITKYPTLPYGGDDAYLTATQPSLPQIRTASLNTIDQALKATGTVPYVPYSNMPTGPFRTTEITPESLQTMQLSYTKQILDAAKDQGLYNASDRLPFVSKTTPGFESTALNLTNKQNTNLTMNYTDKTVNSPPILEKYPVWPRLPFGENNGNT